MTPGNPEDTPLRKALVMLLWDRNISVEERLIKLREASFLISQEIDRLEDVVYI